MMRITIILVSSLTMLSGCCLRRPIDLQVFEQDTLDRKVASFENAVGKRFVCNPKTSMLTAIASHGYPAADAMVERILKPSPSFPLEDAIEVLVHVHFQGWDLRDHKAMPVLEELAATAPAPALRERAEIAVQKIRTNNPLWPRPEFRLKETTPPKERLDESPREHYRDKDARCEAREPPAAAGAVGSVGASSHRLAMECSPLP